MPANTGRQRKRAIRIDGGKEGTSLYVRHSENCLIKKVDAFKVLLGSSEDVHGIRTLQMLHGHRFSQRGKHGSCCDLYPTVIMISNLYPTVITVSVLYL